MAVTNFTNEAKERMLERLDPAKNPESKGLFGIVLLKRNAAGTDWEEYGFSAPDYGGFKSMSWNATITNGVLKQSGQLVFKVEQGIYIEGYRIAYEDLADGRPGWDVDTDTYIYSEEGTFTIANVEISLN